MREDNGHAFFEDISLHRLRAEYHPKHEKRGFSFPIIIIMANQELEKAWFLLTLLSHHVSVVA